MTPFEQQKAIIDEINKSTISFLVPQDLKKTYSSIVREAIKLVGADHGSIVLKNGDDMLRVYSTHKSLYRIKPRKIGLPYKAFKNGTPLLVNQEEVNKMNPKFSEIGIKSIIFIPLFYRNKTIGALNVYYFSNKFFTPDQLSILELFGSMASLAILKNKFYYQVKDISKSEKSYKSLGSILQKVHNASLQFLVPLDIESTYEKIVREAIKLVKAQFGSLALKQGDELVRVYTTLPVADKVKFRSRGFTYRTFVEHRAFVQDEEEIIKAHPEMRKIGIKSNLFIPLANRGQSIGVLIVNAFKENHFRESELNTLKLFGAMATMAIRKAHLYADMRKAVESRDLFISMAAHELRTPVTTMNGYAQLLNQKLSAKNLPEANWAQGLFWEGIRLNLLVNELLQVSRIKSGKLQFDWKESSLTEIINRAVINFRFLHPERTIVVDNQLSQGQDRIIADFDKVLQVLGNLLDNAAKFSPSNTEILFTAKFRSPFFIVCVADKGKGIAKEDLSHVFEGFYRARGEQREGMGLGLYLAKNVIEAHRGDVHISSKIGKGTTVEVKLLKSRL